MDTLQACVLIAVMVSTPSLFLTAWLLRQAPLIELDENSCSASTGDSSSDETSRERGTIKAAPRLLLELTQIGCGLRG
jgi:hypothetical protein